MTHQISHPMVWLSLVEVRRTTRWATVLEMLNIIGAIQGGGEETDIGRELKG